MDDDDSDRTTPNLVSRVLGLAGLAGLLVVMGVVAAARTVHDQTVQLSPDETKLTGVPSNGPQDDLMSPTRLPFARLRMARDETTRDPVDRQVFKLKEMNGFGSFLQQLMTGEPNYDLQYVGYTFDDQHLRLVVSFLGDSTSGKSYLLSNFLEKFESTSDPQARPVYFDQYADENDGKQQTGSMTSGVNLFRGTENIYLDFEGTQGTLPIMDEMGIPQDEEYRTQLSEARRVAVDKYYPSLAYLVSDVVIWVQNVEFTNQAPIQKCINFAESAKSKKHDASHPALVMINNKAVKITEANKWDPIKTTQELAEIHNDQFTSLNKLFDSVKCLIIPRDDAEWRIDNWLDKNGKFQKGKEVFVGEKIFEEQLHKLHTLINHESIQPKFNNTAAWLNHSKEMCTLLNK